MVQFSGDRKPANTRQEEMQWVNTREEEEEGGGEEGKRREARNTSEVNTSEEEDDSERWKSELNVLFLVIKWWHFITTVSKFKANALHVGTVHYFKCLVYEWQ